MQHEQATIMDVVEGDDRPDRPEFDTFWASKLGYCTRQLYLSHLGLKRTAEGRGRLNASRLIQEHLEQQVADHCPHIEVAPQMTTTAGDLCFVGQPTAYDPTTETVYHIKPRNGWYKFHPPNQRHLDQLQVYMQGLDATRGRLIYVSMADLTDTRTWPEDDCAFVDVDDDRFQDVVARARTVRDEIVANGVATTPREIPFQKCGCFLCDSEDLMMDCEIIDDSDSTSTPAVTDGGTTVATNAGASASSRRDLEDVATEPLVTDGYHVPADLKDEEIWVVWDTEYKIARAPWESGTMYPVQWAEDGDVDPREAYEKAEIVADLPVERIHESWPFPSDDELPEAVAPAVLLKHAGDVDADPVTLVDFDNVRDPETMETSQEVLELVDELGGYAELSRSGTGLHVFVRGGLPDDQLTFSAPLEDVGRVEVYDHSRFVATTFNHVEGTPMDRVPEARDALDLLFSLD